MDGKRRNEIQYSASIEKTTPEAAGNVSKKVDEKTPHKPYKSMSAFSETGRVLFFKKKENQVSVSLD